MDEPKARKGRQRPAAPTTPDPVEIAMEIAASGQTPADAAMAVLHANAALMHDQAGLTREQISLSREQIGLARNERFRNRIRAVRDMMLVLTILAVVGGAGSVVWSAHRSSGLVVEPFETPPGMAAGGVDGTVVASRLLDRLSAFQAATGSARAPATYANNWGDDLSVEVAQTGVSVGEVWRLLRQTLGQETRLSGDLTEANGRITLTTRVGAQPGIVVSGDADELDRVLDETARAVYRQTQPYRYAFWLRTVADADPDRRAVLAAERAATLAEMASSTDRTERLWGLVGQSVDARLAGDHELVIVLTNEALALDPTFQGARYNQVFSLELLGRTEEALGEALLFERGMRRRDPQYTESFRDQVGPFFRARIAAWLGDFGTVVEQRRVHWLGTGD